MKLRILVSAFACHPGAGEDPAVGGGENLLGWNLVKQLRRFHEVWVLTSAQNRAGIEAALQREPLPNVQFHYIDLSRWLLPLQRFQGSLQLYSYLWQVRAYFGAQRLHRRVQFDAFHHITYANDWMASFIGALLPVSYIRGPGGGAHRTPKGFLREYSLRGRLWERLRAIGQWVFRHDPFFIMGQQRARVLLVCNREALEAIPHQWRHKAHLFPVNGVSSKDFAWLDSQKNSHEKFGILSAGKLLRLKGFDLGLRAFKTFLEAYTGRYPKVQFTLVGDGPELDRLKLLIRELGLETFVCFRPWMAREKLLREMSSCDVFLFASLRDGGGAVVVEAMAAGKPVICFDIAGPGMHVTNDCGIKVPPQFPEQAVRELAGALERLYRDQELRSWMGRAARERAEQDYHWDRLGERLLEIYERALGTEIGES